MTIINDLFYSTTKILSYNSADFHYRMMYFPLNQNTDQNNPTTRKLYVIFTYVIPTAQFILGIIFFQFIDIQGYYKSYIIFKFCYLLIQSFKTILYFYHYLLAVDVLRIFESYAIMFIALTCLTDPVINEDYRSNAVNLNEIFLRYAETWTLILAFRLIDGYDKIEEEHTLKKLTTSSIIGQYDTSRFVCFLLVAHYYFCIVNGMAYSFRYCLNLFTSPIAYRVVNKLQKKEITKARMLMIFLIGINFLIYVWAFLKSAPNEGDGFDMEKYTQYKQNIKDNSTDI